MWYKNITGRFFGLVTKHTCDRRTDRITTPIAVSLGKNCGLLTWQTKISPNSPAIATSRIVPNICQRQPPTTYLECTRFHPNQFTFDEVIHKRVNTIKIGRKVFPIFNWSLALSQIIINTHTFNKYQNGFVEKWSKFGKMLASQCHW